MLTGTAGGIIGTITGIIGIIWSLVSISMTTEIYNYTQFFPMFTQWLQFSTLPLVLYPINVSSFTIFSIVLSVFLIVSCSLLGVGLYGLYKAGGGAMGLVGLITSTLGSITGSLFIILGSMTESIMVIGGVRNYVIGGFLPVMVSMPNHFIILIGMIVIAISFILLGASSIVVRKTTIRSTTSVAAGILSIIGACFLILYLFTPLQLSPFAFLAGILTLIGFVLILVAFILWAVVFYSSREI